MADETAWLIEMGDPPVYHQLEYDDDWTPDVNKALRFAREQDAKQYVEHIGWTFPNVRVVEHMWPARDSEEDEIYEIGKRDGYEEAVQDIDLATGGDGEFRGSAIPGRTVDVPTMKQRIIDRFNAQTS